MSKHVWTPQELNELFYEALLRDHRSEDYTAQEMRGMANKAAMAVWTPTANRKAARR